MTEPQFAAIVRTQGLRPRMLQEALESLTFQTEPCLAVVVVHGDLLAFEQVKQQCPPPDGLQWVVLHADNLERKRGYPINVGLRYLSDVATGIRYAFLLDDDDLVYPFFTSEMRASFATTAADVVFAASNRRAEGKESEVGFDLGRAHGLLRENFIPTNSYSIRMDKFRKERVWADEQLEYLEDWRFLVALLEHGFRFEPNPSTLSEFSLGSDGNQDRKKDLAAWKAAVLEIRTHINRSLFQVPGGQLAALADDAPAGISAEGSGGHPSVLRLERRIADLENSWSWRVSYPLRLVGEVALRLRSLVKSDRTP